MGWRYRKSINLGPFRINFSKKGIGYSVGCKGYRVTKKAGGGYRRTISIPGTGISHVTEYRSNSVSAPAQYQPKHKKTALLLCIFLGPLGIHRFYVGKIGTGILWLFTLGLFGIGYIVDIFRIAFGSFADQYGIPLD